MIWEKENTAALAAGATFYMATGLIEVKDAEGCRAYLEFLGSRLVFLIDWNHARKQLRAFLRGPDRLTLLNWAAETEAGHRSFLEPGGARVVNQAIEATAGSSLHFGDRLCDLLGDARPQLEAGRVLLRVVACGVCRTDLQIVELPPIQPRLIPG